MPKPSHDDQDAQLSAVFGFTTFRPGQKKAVRAIMSGRDTMVFMPTGSGKSLCYQLAGTMLGGVTLVVGPLISLAQDQARHLSTVGLSCVVLNSTRTKKQIRAAREKILSSQVKFVLTTPERLQSSDITELLSDVGVGQMVIDEAHCVSQWGHDFRPDYLSLAHVRDRLGNPPLVAMTATASPSTVGEIKNALRMQAPEIIRTGIDRVNLALNVRTADSADHKRSLLRQILRGQTRGGQSRGGQTRGGQTPGIGSKLAGPEPAIVYCATTKTVDQLAESMGGLAYHGRMKKADRVAAQQAFLTGPPRVIFATNAFGLGIDKPNVRQVIHFDLPGSLDAYYQEIGRAGRDGQPSRCTLLYDRGDIGLRKTLVSGKIQATEIATAHRAVVNALAADSDSPGDVIHLRAIKKRSPIGRSKLKSCLQLLASRGVVAPVGRGRWRLLVERLDHDKADLLADETKVRLEERQIALRQMADYAESSQCRWQQLIRYFGAGRTVSVDCRCDQCGGGAISKAS